MNEYCTPSFEGNRTCIHAMVNAYMREWPISRCRVECLEYRDAYQECPE